MAAYENIRRRHVDLVARIMPEHIQRIHWPAERLQREREERLRGLLRAALAGSPWHRQRLRGIDPEVFVEADLTTVPPMTKDDLMGHWDEIVTDRRLTLAMVDRHVAGLTSDAYLLGDLHAVASGGSTGRRGVFVYGWEAWAAAFAGFMRFTIWDATTSPAPGPRSMAMVAARNASHMSSALTQTFASPEVRMALFPVTQPIERIVAGLNDCQPATLLGYPSALRVLADEARAGRLRIAPRRVIASSEPLFPEVRQAIEDAFRASVANVYGTSEAGPVAIGCWRGPGMHVSDDLVVLEPVDREGSVVAPGVRADKVYVTPLMNPTLPLIRFELTDQVTFLDRRCPCGSALRLIADVEGRTDDVFTYPGGVVVHPHVFRSVLGRERSISEYQVRQTATGAEILAVGVPADPAAVARAVAGELSRAGLGSPAVRLTPVDRLERQGTGKVRRFVPVEGQAVPGQGTP